MKRTTLALLALLAAALLLVALAWWVGSRRSAPIPEPDPSARSWSVADARSALAERLDEVDLTPEGTEIVLEASEVRRLLIVSLAEHEDTAKLLPAVKEVEVDLLEQEARLGLSVDLSRIDELDLSDEQLQAAEAIEKLLLLLGQKEVYLGVRGMPVAQDDEIVFGPETRVRVSALELSPESFAERFGIAREKIERGISFAVPGYRVLEVEVQSGALRLVLAPA